MLWGGANRPHNAPKGQIMTAGQFMPQGNSRTVGSIHAPAAQIIFGFAEII